MMRNTYMYCTWQPCVFMACFVSLQHSKKHLDPESPNFMTSLVAIGHMTQLCPQEFSGTVKTTISTFIVKDLLMQDKVEYYFFLYVIHV